MVDIRERMFYNEGMDAEMKLELLADNAAFEPAEEKRGEAPSANTVAASKQVSGVREFPCKARR